MKIQRSRYYLGGIGILLLLMVGTLWAVAALASPSGQTAGTIEFGDGDGDPLTHVSSDTSVATGDRTVTVKVTDPDISKLIAVGPDKTRKVSVTFAGDATAVRVDASRYTEIVLDIAGPDMDTASDGAVYPKGQANLEDGWGTVDVTTGDADVLPIVSDPAIDYKASNGIGTASKPEVVVEGLRVQAGKQLIDLRVTKDLVGGDIIVFTYNTSDLDGALASVRGESDEMYLALREPGDGIGDQGVFEGSFVVADGVTIDINNIMEEQHRVKGGLQTAQLKRETIKLAMGDGGDIIDFTVGGDFVTETTIPATTQFTVKVKYPNIKMVDDEGDATNDADEAVSVVSGADVEVESINGSDGDEDRHTITFEADDDIDIGDTVDIEYLGDDRFTIELDHGPAQFGSLAASDGTSLVEDRIFVPQHSGTAGMSLRNPSTEVDDTSANALYTLRGLEGYGSDAEYGVTKLTFSVNEDTPARGTVIGVSYKGVEEITVPATQAITDSNGDGTGDDPAENRFTVRLLSSPQLDIPDAAAPATIGTVSNLGDLAVMKLTGDGTVVALDVDDLRIATGDRPENDATPADMESGISVTFQLGPASDRREIIERGDTLFVYMDEDSDEMPRSNDVYFNPGGAMNADDNDRPIVKETSVGEIRGTYDDGEPRGSAIASTVVENLSPSFGSELPASGSSFGTANVPTLSIVMTDRPAGPDGSGVDADDETDVFYVTTEDYVYDPDNPDYPIGLTDGTDNLAATADFSEDAFGAVTAMLPLVNDPDKRLGNFTELNEIEGAVTVNWWAVVWDESGNRGISDAIPDDDDADTPNDAGNNPYTLIIDATAPKIDEDQSATGLWYKADEDAAKVDDEGVGTGGRLKKDMRTSIGIGFDDAIDADSVDADDFMVMVGDTKVEVTGASVRNGVKVLNSRKTETDTHNYVFLSLAEALAADATPEVSVVATDDRIVNEAGNMLATGDVTIRDGIAPAITVSLPDMVSMEELDIVVSTDEDIVSVPTVQLYDSTGDRVASSAVGSPNRTTGSNEWTYTVDPTPDGVYSVVVTAFDNIPRPRNEGMAGNMDYEDDDAITFEIDTSITEPGDFDPMTGDEVGQNDFIFIEFTWNDEKEYTGDSHDDVMLTTLVLDSGDDNERNILDQATPEGAGTKFSVGVADLGLGEHTLFVNAEDSAGNTLDDDVQITFEVTKIAISLELKRGISHISIPRNPRDRDINAVFGDAMEVQTVFTFDGGESLAAFRDPTTGTFVGSLKNIDAGHAYGVEVTGTVKVEIPVPPLSGGGTPPSVTVSKGWNFVPVITLDDLNDAKQGTVLDADDYLGFNWTSGWTFQSSRWYQIQPDTKNEDINLKDKAQGKGEVLVGSGYWVYFAAADTLTPGTLATAPATE